MEVLVDSITVDGQPMPADATWADLAWAINSPYHVVELDMERFLIGLFLEALSDRAIGQQSQRETRFMLETFGPSHPLNNMMGNISTWMKRYRNALEWST